MADGPFEGTELLCAFDGHFIWLAPTSANAIVQIAVDSGNMALFDGFPLDLSLSTNAFVGAVFDGRHVWFVPLQANGVLRLTVESGEMVLFSRWPVGMTYDVARGIFAGGVFDGQDVWLVPCSADGVVRVSPDTGNMSLFSDWPDGLDRGLLAFAGAAFDGRHIWLVPRTANGVVRVDARTGGMVFFGAYPKEMIHGVSDFVGGVFEGHSVWLVPHNANGRVMLVESIPQQRVDSLSPSRSISRSTSAATSRVSLSLSTVLLPSASASSTISDSGASGWRRRTMTATHVTEASSSFHRRCASGTPTPSLWGKKRVPFRSHTVTLSRVRRHESSGIADNLLRGSLTTAVRVAGIAQLLLAGAVRSPFLANKASTLGRVSSLSGACLWQRAAQGGSDDARPAPDVSWSSFVWAFDGWSGDGTPWVALCSTVLGIAATLSGAVIALGRSPPPALCRNAAASAAAQCAAGAVTVFTAALSYYGPNVAGLAIDCLTRPVSIGAAGAALVVGIAWIAAVGAALVLPQFTPLRRACGPFEEGARQPPSLLRRAHGWLDLVVAHAVAVGCCWCYGSLSACRAGALLVTFLCVAHVAYLVVARPHEHRLEWATSIILSSANAAFACVCCAAAFAVEADRDGIADRVATVGAIVVGLFYAQLVASVALAVHGWWCGPALQGMQETTAAENHAPLLDMTEVPKNPLSL